MASAAVAKRRKSARAAQAAAKQRRQTILVIVLVAVLAAVLAWEVPHLLKRSGASSPTAASTLPVAPASRHKTQPLKGGGAGADPFAGKPGPSQDARAVPGGGSDPFSASAPASHASASAPQVVSAARPIPKQIVIGRPGGHRVARHGWIVILASIPTRSGRGSAVRFARSARASVGRLSILNSSHRRPLRGGYWVVYSGPYSSLAAVSQHAGAVHDAGYRTAYIRELITYR